MSFIRGVKASASLKLDALGQQAVDLGFYPRCKSLGLIEARKSGETPLSSIAGYPRCKSLGLIEAGPPRPFRLPLMAYPRCKSLGLIEATTESIMKVEFEKLSEV